MQRVCNEKDVTLILTTDGSSRLWSEEEKCLVHGLAVFEASQNSPIVTKLQGKWTSYGTEVVALMKAIEKATRGKHRVLVMSDCLSGLLSVTNFSQVGFSKQVNRNPQHILPNHILIVTIHNV